MGTKSHIAIERENGAVESIRCQYDGYPAYNGALLLKHYNTPNRVNALIGLGNITYLAEVLLNFAKKLYNNGQCTPEEKEAAITYYTRAAKKGSKFDWYSSAKWPIQGNEIKSSPSAGVLFKLLPRCEQYGRV